MGFSLVERVILPIGIAFSSRTLARRVRASRRVEEGDRSSQPPQSMLPSIVGTTFASNAESQRCMVPGCVRQCWNRSTSRRCLWRPIKGFGEDDVPLREARRCFRPPPEPASSGNPPSVTPIVSPFLPAPVSDIARIRHSWPPTTFALRDVRWAPVLHPAVRWVVLWCSSFLQFN